MKKDIIKQLQNITNLLIEKNFATHFNFPADKGAEIVWEGYSNISFALKNIPYDELFDECLRVNAYNFILIDGAIVQMMYKIVEDEIVSHRLAFFPNPHTERFQDDTENYESTYTFSDELFSNIYDKKVIPFPVRIDFDVSPEKYVEHDHSFIHLTLGNYKNCRIPISKPLSPNKFILFILRSFYFDWFKTYLDINSLPCNINFTDKLSVEEKKFIHINH
jgi:hypothetical protein